MADWSVRNTPGNDFSSRYLTTSRNSIMRLTGGQSDSVLYHSSSVISSKDEVIGKFCSSDNVDQCVAFLNEEITILGFLSLYDERTSNLDVPSLINVSYELLRLHQRDLRRREELENRLHRKTGDCDQLLAVQSRLRQDREKLERDVAQVMEKERQTSIKAKNLLSKLKTEKEEVKRLQSVIQHRDIQYKHDLKKKERETLKLKERLNQILVDKNQEKNVGMNMLNAIQRTDGRRSTWKTSNATNKQEEEMYRLILTHYEDKQQALMMENSDLRECLYKLQQELVSILNQQELAAKYSPIKPPTEESLSSSEEDVSLSCSSIDKLTSNHFQMPYDIVRDDIEKRFKDGFKILRQNLVNSKKEAEILKSSPCSTCSPRKEDEGEIISLKKKVDKYKDIIKEQEKLIQKSLQSHSRSVENSFLHESQILQEKETLAQERKLFFQQKADFEEDKRRVTEEIIRVRQQRQSLVEEKNMMVQQQTFQRKEGARLLPSTPMFSPAPSKRNQSSTSRIFHHPLTDLSRSLGLSHHAMETGVDDLNFEDDMPTRFRASSTGSLKTRKISADIATRVSGGNASFTQEDLEASRKALFQLSGLTGSRNSPHNGGSI